LQQTQTLPMTELIASSQLLTLRSSIRFTAALPPHHRSPTSATQPAGQDPKAQPAPGIDRSTAPFALGSQYFLDNVIAQLAKFLSTA
jgi:hypothetical protein